MRLPAGVPLVKVTVLLRMNPELHPVLSESFPASRPAARRRFSALRRLLLGAAFFTGFNALAQTAPTLTLVTPAHGASNVAVDTALVFTFDQVMDTQIPVVVSFPPVLVGNLEFVPSGIPQLNGTWSEDQRTLTCRPTVALPAGTSLTWTLNPAGAVAPLANESGDPLETVSGTFTTTQTGNGDCTPDGIPKTWGAYSIAKIMHYEQTSPADPVAASATPFVFGAFVQNRQGGTDIDTGSVNLPDNATRPMTVLAGVLSYRETPDTETALEAAFPPGNYRLSFGLSGRRATVIPMTLPGSPLQAPKIANFAEAQTIDGAQDFILRWNPFSEITAGDSLSLVVIDEATSRVVFQAPDACVPRDLPASATSILIPAGTLANHKTYHATLAFQRIFYSSTNTVPEMAGIGLVNRSTDFPLKTGGSSPADPVRFISYRLLANGHPELTLTGPAMHSYTLQRSSSMSVPLWNPAGTVTLDGTGRATFEDTQPGPAFPLFYRAIAN